MPLRLLVDESLDNSRFYLPELQQLYADVPVRVEVFQAPAGLSHAAAPPWLPWILVPAELAGHAATLELRHRQVLAPAGDGFCFDDDFTRRNRVLWQRPRQEGELLVFAQAGCAPCLSLQRHLTRHGVPFRSCNNRSLLWHELGVQQTPACLWENRYFFEGVQGLAVTPLAYVLPSQSR